MFNYQDQKNDSHIIMKYLTQNDDGSLSKQLQKHLSMEHLKHGVIFQGKYRKRAI